MILYVDAVNGVAGDMLLGALVDAGADFERIGRDLASLPVGGYDLALGHAYHGEVRATRLSVVVREDQPHRHLSDVLAIIRGAQLPVSVVERASESFRRLAEAEGKVHGVPAEEVHFHEVGAVDAIVDVVGTCLAVAQLEERYGPAEVHASPLPVGRGTVTCAHGPMPVPVPAVVELLRGVPVYDNGEEGELVTPTGAALLTAIARGFGPMPPMTLRASGCGGGTRQGKRIPNVVRVLVGEAVADGGTPQTPEAVVLEANLDDAPPQLVAYVAERLLEAGALDVTTTPTVMKKGRAGVVVSVLVTPEQADELATLILTETPTLGVRQHRVARRVLDRRWSRVATPWGEVRVKLGLEGPTVRNAWPEFEDCERIAREADVPLKTVWAAALAAAREVMA